MTLRIARRWAAVLMAWLVVLLCDPPRVQAAGVEDDLKALRQEIEELRRTATERQRQLDDLQRKVEEIEAAGGAAAVPTVAKPEPVATPVADAASALDRAVAGLAPTPSGAGDLWSRQVGGGKIRLIDVSFDTIAAGGTSTATTSKLEGLQGGAHDPDRRGFTLQQAELSLMGAVDPYFSGEGHIIFTPDGVELEEAFMTTSSLPYGLQVEAGYFLTEFGQINPLHPHAWDWLDQPVINTRLFGGDGLRAPGARVGWLLPVDWFSELHGGLQNADEGETTTSFISDEAVGERPAVGREVHALEDLLYLARWENFVDLTPNLGLKAGVSGLYGPNGTGAQGDTWIYGADFKLRWRPQANFRGWPFLLWQTEVMKRDYTADDYVAATATDPTTGGGHSHDEEDEEHEGEAPADLGGDILRDYGFYSQVLYGFHYGWAAGVRFEYASGSKASVDGRQNDPLRDDRFRLSPLLVWQPTEFSRLRLQYNYDDARHLDGNDAHTVWLGAEILYGSHPAHKY